jgi:hypothetical protein
MGLHDCPRRYTADKALEHTQVLGVDLQQTKLEQRNGPLQVRT